jgi:hypothetical protein
VFIFIFSVRPASFTSPTISTFATLAAAPFIERIVVDGENLLVVVVILRTAITRLELAMLGTCPSFTTAASW